MFYISYIKKFIISWILLLELVSLPSHQKKKLNCLYDNLLFHQSEHRQYNVTKGEEIHCIVGETLFFVENPEILEENNTFSTKKGDYRITIESPAILSAGSFIIEEDNSNFHAIAKEDGILSIFLLQSYINSYSNFIVKRGSNQRLIFAGNKTNTYDNSDIQLRFDTKSTIGCIFSNTEESYRVRLRISYSSRYGLFTPGYQYIDSLTYSSYEDDFVITNTKMICATTLALQDVKSASDYIIIEPFNSQEAKNNNDIVKTSSTEGKTYSAISSITNLFYESTLVSSHGFHVIENASYPLTFYAPDKTLLVFHDDQNNSGYFFDNVTKYTLENGPQQLHYSAVLFYEFDSSITADKIKVVTTGESKITITGQYFYVFASPHFHQFKDDARRYFIPLDYKKETLSLAGLSNYIKMRTAVFWSSYSQTFNVYPVAPYSNGYFTNGQLSYSVSTHTFSSPSGLQQTLHFFIGNDDSHCFIPESTNLTFTALTNSYIVFHTKNGFTASYNGKTVNMINTFGFNVKKDGILVLASQENKTFYWSSLIENTGICDSFHIAVGDNIHYGIGPHVSSYKYVINATYTENKHLCSWLVTPDLTPQAYSEGSLYTDILTMDGISRNSYISSNGIQEGSIFITCQPSFYSNPYTLMLYIIQSNKNTSNQSSHNKDFINAQLKIDGDYISLAKNGENPSFWTTSSSYVGVAILAIIDFGIILWIIYYFCIRPRRMKPPVINTPISQPLLYPEEVQVQSAYSLDSSLSNPYTAEAAK